MTARIDLGEGIYLEREECEHGTSGYWFVHPTDDGPELSATPGKCVGLVSTCPHHEHLNGPWTIEAVEPLTLSPSILCRQHGTHGFVRNGEWVPA